MDDDSDPKEKDPEEDADGEVDDNFDDDLVLGNKKPKKGGVHEDEVESLDALADEEDGILPEDSFDDEDLW